MLINHIPLTTGPCLTLYTPFIHVSSRSHTRHLCLCKSSKSFNEILSCSTFCISAILFQPIYLLYQPIYCEFIVAYPYNKLFNHYPSKREKQIGVYVYKEDKHADYRKTQKTKGTKMIPIDLCTYRSHSQRVRIIKGDRSVVNATLRVEMDQTTSAACSQQCIHLKRTRTVNPVPACKRPAGMRLSTWT